MAAHRDRIPGRSCSCGVYAASTPEGLARAGVLTESVGVVGVIAMWGTVIEHDRGARAQLAYPARLRLICGPCLQQGRGAVDPAVVIGSGTSLALCARHAIGRRGPRTPAARVQADLLSKYAVDLVPLERVSSALKIPHAPRDPLDLATRVVESAVPALGSVLHALLFLWTIAGFLFMAFWIAAFVAEPFLGD